MDTASPEPLSSQPRPKRRTKPTKCEQYHEQILNGLNAGQSQRQVAAKLGIAHSSISEWLDSLDQQKQQLSRYRSNRADALSQIQSKALTLQSKVLDSLLEDGLLASATPSQKAGLMQSLNIVIGTSYDKERLETGQSTQNHSIVAKMLSSAVSDIYKPLKSKGTESTAPQSGAGSQVQDSSGTTYVETQQEHVPCQDPEAGDPGGMGENESVSSPSPAPQLKS